MQFSLKRALIIVGIVLLIAALVEIAGLLRLRSSISLYRQYWDSRKDESGELLYVALGDSAGQGIGASAPQNGYVGIIADRIEQKTGKGVKVINLSRSGAKVEDALREQLPELKKYKPDSVTIEIGANDVAQVFNADDFERDFDALAAQLPKHTVVANMPYFGGILRKNSTALEANKIIDRVTKKYALSQVDLQSYTKERNSLWVYSADLFHPNNRGYSNWAEVFWTEVEPRIKS